MPRILYVAWLLCVHRVRYPFVPSGGRQKQRISYGLERKMPDMSALVLANNKRGCVGPIAGLLFVLCGSWPNMGQPRNQEVLDATAALAE
jgi:hypothetical protein